MSEIEFTFEQAYELEATANGFKCKIASNHGNVKELEYTLTEADAKLAIDEVAIREIKQAWEEMKEELEQTIPDNAVVDAQGNITIDNSADVEQPIATFAKDYVTPEDLEKGKIEAADAVSDTLPVEKVKP